MFSVWGVALPRITFHYGIVFSAFLKTIYGRFFENRGDYKEYDQNEDKNSPPSVSFHLE